MQMHSFFIYIVLAQADSLSLWFRECATVLMNTKELKFARAVLRYVIGNNSVFCFWFRFAKSINLYSLKGRVLLPLLIIL